MKIALIVPGGVDRGGSVRVIPFLLWLIERLAREHEVHVFALHQESGPGRWPLRGATVHNIGRRPHRLRALIELAAEHRRGAFDIVHGFWASGPGVVGAAFARLTGVPSVVTLPGGDLVALPAIGYGAQLTLRGRIGVRWALKQADRIIAVSDWIKDQALGHGYRSVRIPLGVSLDEWPARPPVRRKAGGLLRLLHVADISPIKDQKTLLPAMALLGRQGVEFHLDVIGMDHSLGAIAQGAEALGLGDCVTFHGHLPHDQCRAWFDQAHLLVMSSLHEAIPIVLSEAAIAGVPTVGTAVGQMADWTPHAAVTVPVASAEGLAAAIKCLADDEDLRMRLAGAAQAIAVREDADYTARQLASLYSELAAARVTNR